jgi:hypothetical protein
VQGITGTMPVIAAAFAARCRKQEDVNACRCVLRERPADAERFVVGMGEHGHQSE